MSAPDLRSCSIASTVGITISSTSRRSASVITSSATGSDPEAPLPSTRRLHGHGMSSAAVSGVCPYLPRSAFEGPLLPLPDPPTFDHDVVLVGHTVDLDRPEHEPPELHLDLSSLVTDLFASRSS